MLRRVLVCGGRGYTDAARIAEVIGIFDPQAVTIVHGNARGADRTAANVALTLGFDVEAHPADWEEYGNAAGPIRNQAMLDTGVDLVVAFPGGRGTADMTDRAKRAGVPVLPII